MGTKEGTHSLDFGAGYRMWVDENGVLQYSPSSSVSSPVTGDQVPGQFVVACVDYDARVLPGNDDTAAVGISSDLNTAIAMARLTPFKTYERVSQVAPAVGNGANLYVMGKGRVGGATYRNRLNTADQTASWRSNFIGYNRMCCRSTGDFSDTIFDKIQAGFVPATGTNTAGYSPTGSPTANTFSVQLAGGGAANLPTETNGISGITGFRIRFDANTATVALRNATGCVWKNTASQITISTNMGTVPSTSDVFYIEMTELQFGSGTCHYNDTANATISIVGERYTATSSISGPPSGVINMAGCESTAAISMLRMSSASFFINGFDPNGTFFGIGTGGRFAGNMTISDITSFGVSNITLSTGGLQIVRNVVFYSGLGAGSVFATGMQDAGGPGSASNSISGTQIPLRSIGNLFAPSTTQRLKIPGNGAFGAGILVNVPGISICGVDFANQATACVALGGPHTASLGQFMTVDDIVSTDGGNTGAVLRMACQNSTVRWGSRVANTAAATRDIDLATGVVVGTFAGLATTNYFDHTGNNVIGAAGIVVDKPGKLFTNRTATAAIGNIMRSNGTSAECTIARADSAGNAAGIVGVAMTDAAVGATMLVAGPGSEVQVLFGSAPTAGAIGYLSTATAGLAQTASPALAGSNQKNRLGVVQAVTGNFGLMGFNPDNLAITADGNP